MTPLPLWRSLAWLPCLTLGWLAACSHSSAPNQVTADQPAGTPPALLGDAVFESPFLSHGDGLYSGSGVLGAWQVTLHSDGAVGMEPLAVRSGAALGDTYLVNIDDYMGGKICGDCVKVAGMGRPVPGQPNVVEVLFEARHPIPLPPPGADGTLGSHRLDLHVHDVQALIVAEGNTVFNPKVKVIRGENVQFFPARTNPALLVNADGYSSHLDPDIDNFYPTNSNIHPYKILFQDPANGNYNPAIAPINGYPDLRNPTGHNVMPMGAGYRATPFQFFVPNNAQREFLMVVSCAYGISAQGRGTDIGKRMNPRYFLPLFNLKEAWKVKTTVRDNGLIGSSPGTSAKVDIEVWDWQQLAQVDPQFNGGSSNLNRLDRESKLRNAEVEVPALGYSKLLAAADFTGSGQETTPLKATITINNASLAPGGNYWGLVAVRDDLDSLITNTKGISKDLTTIFGLRDFSTYQTFLLEVAPAPNPPVAIIQTTPNPPIIDAGVPMVFDGSLSFDPDGSIVSYEWDFNYSGSPLSFEVQGTGMSLNHAFSVPGSYSVALKVTDNNDPPLSGLAVKTVTVNCPTTVVSNCTVDAFPAYTGFSFNTAWSLENGKMDIAFLGDGKLVFEDNKVLKTAAVSIGVTGVAPTPLIPGYPGQHVSSIDVDRLGRVIWVPWEEALGFEDAPITSLNVGPLGDKHRGVKNTVHVVVKQPSNQWIEAAIFDFGEPVHAVTTDELNNIWVLTASHKLRKISDDLVLTPFNVDLDVSAGYAPVWNIGEVFDMAADFKSNCFYVLTSGLESGTIDDDPDYRGGAYANIWRFECDGSYSTTTPAGNPNPLRDMLIIPPIGYPLFNWFGFDALADITVDNFAGAGYGTTLTGPQNCQIIVGGSGLVAGEGIRIATTFSRFDSDFGQADSILIPNTVGMRALAIKPDGSNTLVGIAADENATQVLEFYNFFGGWQ